MADPLSASRFVRVLREEGLKVVEVRSWRTHNRNHKGAWGPINGVMIHHTVTRGTEASVSLCYEGHSSLPGPLCHGVIAKDGTVYLVGNGRANHAGLGDDNVLRAVINEDSSLPATNERNTDGNARFYGFECINLGDGEDPWPAAQLDAIERASAAICRHYGWSAESVIGHKEWTNTKIDPRGFSMEEMRRRINTRLAGPAGVQEDDVTPEDIDKIADRVVDKLLSADRIRVPWESDNEFNQVNNAWESMWRQTHEAVGELGSLGKQVSLLREQVDSLTLGGVDLDALVDKLAQRLAQ